MKNTLTWHAQYLTQKGRKAENQDSLCITYAQHQGNVQQHQSPDLAVQQLSQHACTINEAAPKTEQLENTSWLLVMLADGVSACQHPKKASQTVVDTVQQQLSKALSAYFLDCSQADGASEIDDNRIAMMIRQAVQDANDVLYFSDGYQRNATMLTTLTGVVIYGNVMQLFHTGDSRLYHVENNHVSVLSADHRVKRGADKGALSAALGADGVIQLQQAVHRVHQDAKYVLMTDGVYEDIADTEMQFELTQPVNKDDNLCKRLCDIALEHGSTDNLSCIALTALDTKAQRTEHSDLSVQQHTKPSLSHYRMLQPLQTGDEIDGFTVTKPLTHTPRSSVYLVSAVEQGKPSARVLKMPSLNSSQDGDYLRTFLKEKKIGLSLSRSSQDAEVQTGLLQYYPTPAGSDYLYLLTEYVEGQTLREFIDTHAPCDLEQSYDLVCKIGMALRKMHRQYLLHQDVKPENIMVTASGHIKLLDFGASSSLILKENTNAPQGDLNYTAPEYYTHEPKGVYSDLFSLAMISYELLTNQLPFSHQDIANQKKLIMPTKALQARNVPFSLQEVLMRGLHSQHDIRYQSIGEFLDALNPEHVRQTKSVPLLERNPVLFWKGVSALLLVLLLVVLSVK